MSDTPNQNSDAIFTPPRLVAVIDIGASSLRMQIAEINVGTQEVRRLESFSQAVSIGSDSFGGRRINKTTIEDCIRVLAIYRKKLDEYGINDPTQIRVVATSGVREASNRTTFIDRVFIATGFEVEPFDEAELHRVTYFGILPFMENRPKLFADESLVLEVGGGSSELLMLRKTDVEFSRTYRLGSLRMRHSLEDFDGPISKTRSLMESQISKTITEFEAAAKHPRPKIQIAMGGDVRFAAAEITQKPITDKLVEIKLNDLIRFTNRILDKSPNQLATKYHMSLPEAKSLGPGLLTQVLFAQKLNVKKFYVAEVNLRDGLIQEMSLDGAWGESIHNQIFRSAVQLGRKFKFNEAHAVHVSQLACAMFDDLADLHQLSPRHRSILELAALLHEIGYFVSPRSKHKHSMYLISNAEIFGVGSRELNLIALVARYHRGANPNSRHVGYSQLERNDRVAVAKLAAMLRLAKAFDVSQTQRVQKLTSTMSGNRLQFEPHDVVDLALERLEIGQVSGLFEDVFGAEVIL
jgi:exopolyphosphatase/guanosine-5'-triphosphate,3'-diphosphate pyrophosphatase